MLSICTKFHKNILKGLIGIVGLDFQYFKGAKFRKNVSIVIDLVLCTSFDHALYSYLVS